MGLPRLETKQSYIFGKIPDSGVRPGPNFSNTSHVSLQWAKLLQVTLSYLKIVSGNSVGKHMLDISTFLAETSIDFLQAYANWLVVIKATCDEAATKIWYEYYNRMIAYPEFVCWYPTWFEMDKVLRVQCLSLKAAIPNVLSMLYLFLIESHKNCQSRPASFMVCPS